MPEAEEALLVRTHDCTQPQLLPVGEESVVVRTYDCTQLVPETEESVVVRTHDCTQLVPGAEKALVVRTHAQDLQTRDKREYRIIWRHNTRSKQSLVRS